MQSVKVLDSDTKDDFVVIPVQISFSSDLTRLVKFVQSIETDKKLLTIPELKIRVKNELKPHGCIGDADGCRLHEKRGNQEVGRRDRGFMHLFKIRFMAVLLAVALTACSAFNGQVAQTDDPLQDGAALGDQTENAGHSRCFSACSGRKKIRCSPAHSNPCSEGHTR